MSSPLSGFLSRFSPLVPGMDYVSYTDEVITDNDASSDGFVESYSSLLPSKYSPYRVVNCCNGLILLVSESVCRYYVCNLAIKQCVAIPKALAHTKVHNAMNAFDPHESSHYKIICFPNSLHCPAFKTPELDVFSSETRKWIRYPVPLDKGSNWIKHNVYLAGMLYKLTESKQLLIFDLKKLTARAIEVPYKDKTDTYGFIGVSKGILHYANSDGSSMLIWQLDYRSKDGCFWILKHSICFRDLIAKHPDGWILYDRRNIYTCKPYAIHPTLDIIFLGTPRMIFIYHLKIEKLELLCTRPFERPLLWGQHGFYLYSRCFIMLDDFSKGRHQSSQL